ncbi:MULTISPECIES: helix-turn-helix transcriptional regulator [Rhizobium]|jgi:transcriptional regulator with XRE-family HTH domain|uniref:helix-turn-helix domain-containing protein n=1 Tax=Rhizobium sp. 60-20 TaxID=1895819 RepID=UPI0009DDC266
MDKRPDAIDVEVGSRIRLRREELSISQAELAERLCISPRQLGKVECGFEKISASRLLRISEILGVPAMFFFESTSDDISSSRETPARFRLARHHRAVREQPYRGSKTSGCGQKSSPL